MPKSYRIGVFVETTRIYGRKVSEGIADYARERRGGWVVTAGGDLLRTDIAALRGKLDGVLARIPDARTARALAALRVPVVDFYCWKDWPGVAGVDGDHAAVGRMAAAWFLARRFRNFAFCGYPGAPFSDLRRAAFVRAVEEAGFSCAVYESDKYRGNYLRRMALGPENYGAPRDDVELCRWLRSLPSRTAILCCHDSRAYQVAHAARAAGLRVPDDIAVMGVDDDPIICGLTDPMLTSVDNNARGVGRVGAALLDRLLSARRPVRAVPRLLVPPTGVVERASTETDPVDPPWLADALRFMRASLGERINAQDVIRHTGLSHTKVERTFRGVLGHTLHAELATLRMDEACRLLRGTSLDVATVAARAGYATPQYFCHQFRLVHRTTPAAYRMRNS